MSLGSASGGGGGHGAGGIRAGGAFVEIWAEDSKLRKSLKHAKEGFEHFGGLISKVGFASLAPDLLKLTIIGEAFHGAVEQASDMKLLAMQIGATTEETSRLAFAFSTAGVDSEDFAMMAQQLSRKLLEANQGMAESQKYFTQLGLNFEELAKAPLKEQFLKIGAALLKLPPGAMRTGAAMELMGRGGAKALRLLAEGPEKFAERMAESDEVGATITEAMAEDARKVEVAWHATTTALKNAFLSIGRALLPEAENIEQFAGKIREAVKGVTEWIRENKALIISILSGAAAFVVIDVAIIALGGAVAAVGTLIGAFSTLIGVVGGLGAFLVSPLGLAVVALAAVAIGADYLTGCFTAMFQRLKAGFDEMLQDGKQAWGGIVDAVSAGNLELAASIALAFLTLEWAKVVAYWTRQWVNFKDIFVDGWHTIGFAISSIWNDVTTGLETALHGMIAAVIDGANWALRQVGASEISTGGLDRWRAKIDREHDAELDRIGKAKNDLDQANARFRANQNAAAEAEVAAARAELDRLVEKAHAGRREKKNEGEESGMKSPEAILAKLPDSVRGAFSSTNWGQRLGAGDKIPAQMLAVAQDNNKLLGQVNDAVKAFVDNMPVARFG